MNNSGKETTQSLNERIDAVLDELALQVLEDGGKTVNGVTTSKSEACSAILSTVKAAMPEKFTPSSYEEKYGPGSFARDAYEMSGYNAAIDAMTTVLEGKS